jgi:acetyl esterase/lipase
VLGSAASLDPLERQDWRASIIRGRTRHQTQGEFVQLLSHHVGNETRPRPSRRHVAVVVAAVLTLFATACQIQNIAPGGAAPLRYRDLVFPGATVTSNITYGSAVNQAGTTVTLKLDMYTPTGDTVTGRPAIVWVHGGSFSSGSKTSAELVDEATTFARKGYVNVSIDYRLVSGGCSAGGPTPACVIAIQDAKHDAFAAVRFLRANASTYGIDPDRIAIGGTSAGAITAMNVAYDSTDPGTSGNPGFPSNVQAAVSLSGAKVFGAYDAGDAPTLLFHGTADPLVPYQWAVNTVNGATAANLESYLTTWEGAGHVPYVAHRQEILDQTTNFLYWELDLFELNAPT